ncbi:MAG: nucleotidyltransferase [Deltaproteobacteria bacterium]|nr:nucleotidyltransferase [Deltaproteobacteria bacterium]
MVVPAIEESSGIRVDFIFSFTPYEAEAIKRARKVVINLREVRFASPEDLIIHKIFAGRAIDLEDVKVIVLKVNNLDIQYIVRWLREFDSSFEGSNFLESFNIILDNISSK